MNSLDDNAPLILLFYHRIKNFTLYNNNSCDGNRTLIRGPKPYF
jgi:hypothetical protein